MKAYYKLQRIQWHFFSNSLSVLKMTSVVSKEFPLRAGCCCCCWWWWWWWRRRWWWLVGWLVTNVSATCWCISGTDLLRQFTCCHTEIEADQTLYLTQSQYTDTRPTSPSADPLRVRQFIDCCASLSASLCHFSSRQVINQSINRLL